MKISINTKNLLLSVILFVGITKTTAQMVNYKIIVNEPDKRNLFIHINPFNVNTYSPNVTIGFNIQATWLASKHFQFQLDYRKAYLDGEATGVFSPKGLKKASQFELGGTLNLINHIKNVSHRIVLSSTRSGNYTLTKSLHVVAEARKIFAVRGGFISFYNNLHINNSFNGDSVIGKYSNGTTKRVFDDVSFETINYTVRSAGFYAGIDFKTIKNLIISTNDYGEKGCRTVGNFYADILFTPLVKYEIKQPGFTDININIPDNKRKLIGWRAGYQWATNRSFGFNYKIEFGQQPGVATHNNFFLAAGMGFTIGLKTKQLPI
jgi:hypothetical protein